MNKYLKMISSISLTLLVWFAWSYFTMGSIESWYIDLNKPSFNPPNWIFWPVWTILYILIWISFYLIWMKWFWAEKSKVKIVYFLQLLLNFSWSFTFFYLQNPLYWLVNIILLWLIIIYNIILFYKIDKKAWSIMIPYLLWVTFASALNLSLYILN